MTARRPSFDRLASGYRFLEMLAFGRDLERARFRFVDKLSASTSILILGEGDGRFLSRLLPLVPAARIDCIDSSRAMLAKAEQRIAGSPHRARVQFECADVLTYGFAAKRYDAVVTLFFLDCFAHRDAESVVNGIAGAVTADATWLYADFAMPPRGVRRVRAWLWLTLLYAFFRWQTGLRTRELPPAESLIKQHGFSENAGLTLQCGLLRSVWFQRR